DAESEAAEDGETAQLQARDDSTAEIGSDRGIPGERVAAGREQDELLIEQAEIEGQQQWDDDQYGATGNQATENDAFHAQCTIAAARWHGSAGPCHALGHSGLRSASLTTNGSPCQPARAIRRCRR